MIFETQRTQRHLFHDVIARRPQGRRGNPVFWIASLPLAMTLLAISALLITGCIKEEWVGVVYFKGNDPLHVGTFESFEQCFRITGDRAEELGVFYAGACLKDCNYNFLVEQDVCAVATDI